MSELIRSDFCTCLSFTCVFGQVPGCSTGGVRNPFFDETSDLLKLDTKVMAEELAVSGIRYIKSLGKEQCETFISECLVVKKKPLTITKKQA